MFFKVPEIIAIIDIVINTVLVIGLAIFIQKSQINSRTLKDYFIKELEKMHSELALFLDELEEGGIKPKEIQSSFFTKIAMTNNITKIIDVKYKIRSNELVINLQYLQTLVETDTHYNANFSRNKITVLTSNSIGDIRQFRASKIKIFHELIVRVNDSNKILF